MLTRCPNPSCRLVFEVLRAREGKNGPCPGCGQVITFRSLDLLKKLDRQRQQLVEKKRGADALASGAGALPWLSVLLEDVRSLWNVGSIFRTADGAGFSHLYLCGITGCPPRKEIAKTSLGAEQHLSWSYAAGALSIVPRLKARGVRILGLERTESSEPLARALARQAVRGPVCLAVGNEVRGLSAELLGACDGVCHLPMRGLKNSLNVAVAFGVAAYLLSEALPAREEPPQESAGK